MSSSDYVNIFSVTFSIMAYNYFIVTCLSTMREVLVTWPWLTNIQLTGNRPGGPKCFHAIVFMFVKSVCYCIVLYPKFAKGAREIKLFAEV